MKLCKKIKIHLIPGAVRFYIENYMYHNNVGPAYIIYSTITKNVDAIFFIAFNEYVEHKISEIRFDRFSLAWHTGHYTRYDSSYIKIFKKSVDSEIESSSTRGLKIFSNEIELNQYYNALVETNNMVDYLKTKRLHLNKLDVDKLTNQLRRYYETL